MAKVKAFNRGDRVHNPKTGVAFIVEAMARSVVHGRVRQVVYGTCGEREFADDVELLLLDAEKIKRQEAYEAKMRDEERGFASTIWQYEVNRTPPLLRGEAEKNLIEHLSAFRATVEAEFAEHHKLFR